MKNEIILLINNFTGVNKNIYLFNPLIQQNIIVDVNDTVYAPLQSIDGMQKILNQSIPAGNEELNGTVGFDWNGNLKGFPAGLGNFQITSLKYPYYSLLEFLKTDEIFIHSVKMDCPNQLQLNINWEYVKTYPNGQTKVENIIMDSSISPVQVQPNIRISKINKIINKFSGFRINVLNNNPLTLTFQFSFSKNFQP